MTVVEHNGRMSSRPALQFPEGKRFAFTILDDTDDATVDNVRPIYSLLRSLGFRTTKTAWPLDCPEGSRKFFAAETLQNAEYLAFVRQLVADGFELAFHGATMESSHRERTIAGLEFIDREIGAPMSVYCNHGQNRENLYWGADRYRTAMLRLPLQAAGRALRKPTYYGHVPQSPYFWGDIAKERFRFVRNFAFATLNQARIHPVGPYRLRSTPYVNYWFNTADAPDVHAFKRLVTPEGLEALEQEGGVCILSTHLGKGFVRDGRVDPDVERTLRYLADRPGWFVPTSRLLEHLLRVAPGGELSAREQWALELRHFFDRLNNRLHRDNTK